MLDELLAKQGKNGTCRQVEATPCAPGSFYRHEKNKILVCTDPLVAMSQTVLPSSIRPRPVFLVYEPVRRDTQESVACMTPRARCISVHKWPPTFICRLGAAGTASETTSCSRRYASREDLRAYGLMYNVNILRSDCNSGHHQHYISVYEVCSRYTIIGKPFSACFVYLFS